MAVGKNTVTLTFAGDTKSLDAATARAAHDLEAMGRSTQGASKLSKSMGESLEATGHKARGASEALRGVGDASMLMGNGLGAGVQNMVFASQAVHGLTKGTGTLISSLGLLRTAGLAAGGALLAFGLQQEAASAGSDNFVQKGLKDLNYALATNINFVTQGIPLVGSLTGMWRHSADETSKAAHDITGALSQLEIQEINTGNAAGIAAAQVAALRSSQSAYGPYKTGYKFDTNNPGYQDAVYQANMHPVSIKAATSGGGGGGGGGGSAIKKAAMATGKAWVDGIAVGIDHSATDVESAIKKVTDKAKAILDKAKALAKQIAQTFTYSLNAQTIDASTNMRGPSLLQNFKDQVANLHAFRTVISQLQKQGLNGSMLSKLVDAGPDALGAAQEILSSGDVGALNKLQKTYKKDQTGLANSEVLRRQGVDMTKAHPVRVVFDVTGADKEMKALIKKIVRVDGGGSVSVAFGKGGKK